ncbi:MAG: hypothetical protein C7B44_14180 [Sulfobacillus thermosulfidooxidans]|nr:MAG: hypothetical protein C7B44_14180 [Sulfobacillus thermosulfidooxidans]
MRDATKQCHLPSGTWASLEANRIQRPRMTLITKLSAGLSIPLLALAIVSGYFERENEPESFATILNAENHDSQVKRRSAKEWSIQLSAWGLEYLSIITRGRRNLERLIERWADTSRLSLQDTELHILTTTGELPQAWQTHTQKWLSDVSAPWLWSWLNTFDDAAAGAKAETDHTPSQALWIDLIALFVIMRRIQHAVAKSCGCESDYTHGMTVIHSFIQTHNIHHYRTAMHHIHWQQPNIFEKYQNDDTTTLAEATQLFLQSLDLLIPGFAQHITNATYRRSTQELLRHWNTLDEEQRQRVLEIVKIPN